jgi:cytochrome c-type biogenesis protein CcmE
MNLEIQPHTGKKKTSQKFYIGGLIILAAVVYLIVTSTLTSAQYFYTIDELLGRGPDVVGQSVRLTGAVLGEDIQYNPETLTLSFTIVNIPADQDLVNAAGGLAEALHEAVLDEDRSHLQVVYVGVKPDLLRNEAQAIVTGELGEDGIFYANELLLRCPTRYEEAVPEQVEG